MLLNESFNLTHCPYYQENQLNETLLLTFHSSLYFLFIHFLPGNILRNNFSFVETPVHLVLLFKYNVNDRGGRKCYILFIYIYIYVSIFI